MFYHQKIQLFRFLTVVKNSTVKRYRGGRTINIPPSGDSGLISIRECQTLLGISSNVTLNVYLKNLGFYGQRFISWEQFKDILQLQVFLGLKHGYNSKEMYLTLRRENSLQPIFEEYGVNIETRFERLKDDYNKRQAQK
ncbi:MAG: hypothetical protein PUP93_28630, partial [Rhizonema sp. NSF051]|nr:hypothetical protein [Rhizonema sp. NSF051]